GFLEASLESSGGQACGQGNIPLNAQPHSPAQESGTVYLSAGCSLAGGTLSSTFVSPGFTVPLPPERLP
ncbi:MAG: hypothetical protein ACREDE_10955, partial [Thermoplasmata archaeon]